MSAEGKSEKQEHKAVVVADDKKKGGGHDKTEEKHGGLTAFQHAWEKSKKAALRGGIPGMAAMMMQVTTLMWLRTTINYSYAHGGTSMRKALSHLWKNGGIRRLYAGYGWAMIQAPTSRFGDAAANAGVITLLEELDTTKNLPLPVKTAMASTLGAGFRILLMPIDALKSTAQSHGGSPIPLLAAKIKSSGPQVMFHGALAAAFANFLGSLTWFTPYRYFDTHVELWKKTDVLYQKLMRSMALGFCASIISDTTTNSVRVIKVVRQTSAVPISYVAAVNKVIAEEGVVGLFGRGLTTKLVSNGIQGMMFSVVWRLGMEAWDKNEKNKKKSSH